MKPRSCWSVLAKKAQDEEDTAQTAAAKARNKVIELQQSRHRMNELLEDYKKRAIASQAQLQTMSQTTNSRQFLLQLQQLEQHLHHGGWPLFSLTQLTSD
jgi:hypothetical protein